MEKGKVMGVSKKASIVSSVVAAICIVIYIAAIGFGAVRIITSIRDRHNYAEEEFRILTDRATSSAVFLGFMSEAYQETIRDFLASSKTPLLGIIITGSGGEYAFEPAAGSGIVWSGSSPRFKTGAAWPDEPFQMPLRIEGQRNVNIRAIYSRIDYYAFVIILRDTLLAVLFALAIALVTLIIEMALKNRAAASVAAHKEEPAGSAISEGAEEPVADAADDGGYATTDDNFDYGYEAFTSDISDDASDDVLYDTSGEKEKNPRGLYTPANIGWESYINDRLASELHRCASSEQDLTYLVMEFPSINSGDLYRLFAEEAVGFFSMRDLIFEKGEKGISVILPGVDLEKGMAKSEEFRGRVAAKMPGSFKGRSNLCVGLSSRSGRLIDSERIMLEASTALEKAQEDPSSPIVAFKSDPEKYREFLKRKSK